MNLYTAAKNALIEVLEEGLPNTIEEAARRLLCDADARRVLFNSYVGQDKMVADVISRARRPMRVA